MLMLDSSWARWSEFAGVHRHVRDCGGTIVTAVYDILPLQLPHMMVKGGPEWFEGWLKEALSASDALLCISRAVADDLAAYIDAAGADRYRDLRIGYWHLGGDFDRTSQGAVSAQVKSAFSRHAFLMVGTIEPRKRHATALDACESLWDAGRDVSLVIIGKAGWLVEDLMARLERHPQLGRRLHLFTEASDADLQFAYTHARSLLFPSAGEGFGLPLVEAAHYGLPVIANDLPVLREIGGDAVTFVNSDDPATFSEGIVRWLDADARGATPDSRNMHYLTWSESAAQLLEVVVDNRWYRIV